MASASTRRTRKEKQIKSQIAKTKEFIKIKAENTEIEHYTKLMKLKAGTLIVLTEIKTHVRAIRFSFTW